MIIPSFYNIQQQRKKISCYNKKIASVSESEPSATESLQENQGLGILGQISSHTYWLCLKFLEKEQLCHIFTFGFESKSLDSKQQHCKD